MSITSALFSGVNILGKACLDNLPVIQTGFSLFGTIMTPIWTAKSTLKAKEIIDAAKEKRGEDISKGEMVELTWKEFVGPIILCGLTCACEIKTTKDLLSKAATMTALAATSKATLDQQKDKTIELLGDGKAQKVNDAVAKEKVDAISQRYGGAIPFVGDGKILCIDGFSERLFVSTVEDIRSAVNDINEALIPGGTWSSENQMTLNDFYSSINDAANLGPLQAGYHLGWLTGNPLKIDISTQMYKERMPVAYIQYTIYDLNSGKPVV